MGGGAKGGGATGEADLRYREYLRLSPAGFVVLDGEGRLLEANEAVCRLSGYSKSELEQMTLFDLLAPEAVVTGRLLLRRALTEGPVESDLRCQHKEGRPLTFALEAAAAGDGKLIAFCRDVTERRRREDALAASDARFSVLMSNAQAIIFMMDREGTFILSEGKGLAALGLAPGQVVGTSARDMYAAYPDVIEGIDEALRGRTHHATVEVQDTFFDVFFSPCAGPDGQTDGAIGVAIDVSARVRTDEERRRLALQVQQAQKLESLGLLAGGIAHDFNNLLVTILGGAEMLQRELAAGDARLRRAERIAHAANQAAALCRQLLAYAGRTSSEIQPLDLNHVVGELLPLLEIAVAKGVSLRFVPSPGLPTIEADSTQIGQVAMNLVCNASEALDGKGGNVELRTGLRRIANEDLVDHHLGAERAAGQYVYLEVCDDGAGMDATTAARLFEPFFTTKFTGRGLGMTTVRGIAQAHHGLLRVDSKPGKGTTISVLFPRSNGRPRVNAVTPSPATTAGCGGTVLVVDDEEPVLRTVSMLLGSVGFEVVAVSSGAAALQRLNEGRERIRCVLLDVTMPQMSGVECLLRIRQQWPDLPVLLTSGYAAQEVGSAISDDPHTAFLQKPYRLSSLCDKLDEVAPTATAPS